MLLYCCRSRRNFFPLQRTFSTTFNRYALFFFLCFCFVLFFFLVFLFSLFFLILLLWVFLMFFFLFILFCFCSFFVFFFWPLRFSFCDFWFINHFIVCFVCVLFFKHFYLHTFAQLFLPQMLNLVG